MAAEEGEVGEMPGLSRVGRLVVTLAALAVIAAAASGAIVLAQQPAARAVGAVPAAAPIDLELGLDGARAASIKSVSGCTTTGVVSTTIPNPPTKSLTGISISPCVIQHGGVSPAFGNWIKNQLGTAPTNTHTFQLVAFDSSLNISSCIQVSHASLTRFSTPALDSSSNAAVYLTSTITGSSIRPAAVATCHLTDAPKPKVLGPNIALLSVGGTIEAAQHISAITVSRGTNTWLTADFTVTTPNTGTSVNDYTSWYSATVLHTPVVTAEREAQLRLLGTDLSTVLLTINLHNTGLDAEDAGMGASRVWTMYFESLTPVF